MIDFKELDKKIQHGYLLVLENHLYEGCDEWLRAWEDIKQLMTETGAKNLYELDEKYTWSESGAPSEYVEDMKTELRSAGIKSPDYQMKYDSCCQDIAGYIGDGIKPGRNKRYSLNNGFYLQEISESDLANLTIKKDAAPLIKQIKTGRNEPCPCGSGKKYKKCCGVKMVV